MTDLLVFSTLGKSYGVATYFSWDPEEKCYTAEERLNLPLSMIGFQLLSPERAVIVVKFPSEANGGPAVDAGKTCFTV